MGPPLPKRIKRYRIQYSVILIISFEKLIVKYYLTNARGLKLFTDHLIRVQVAAVVEQH